eukprot:108131_1
MSIQMCGSRIEDDESYFHGISEKLVFPTYFNHLRKLSNGIIIKCPLSTTESYEIAADFAADGLIIEFGAIVSKTQCQCFSTAWLSDFPSEREYLFIQNRHPLKINDIIDPSTSSHYGEFLRALELIICLINMTDMSRDRRLYQKSMCVGGRYGPYRLTIPHESEYIEKHMYKSCDDSTSVLIKGLIDHQTSSVEFKSLHEHAKRICNVFFNNQTTITIDYLMWKKKYRFMYDIFSYFKYEWVNIDMINKLFPNVQHLTVRKINLCSQTLNNILISLNDKSSIETICIEPNTESDLSLNQALLNYTESFTTRNLFICVDVVKQQLIVDKCKFRYVVKLIEGCGKLKCANQEIIHLQQLLIAQHKSLELSSSNDVVYDRNQELFYHYCSEKTHLHIVLNTKILQLFGNLRHEWINLNTINALFSNITVLTVDNVKLSLFLFENILKHLKNGNTNLTKINLNLHSYSIDHISDDGRRIHYGMRSQDMFPEFGTMYWYDRKSLDQLYYVRSLLYQEITKDGYNDLIGSQLREMNMIIMSYAIYKYNHKFQEIKFHMYLASYCTDDRFEDDILCIQK